MLQEIQDQNALLREQNNALIGEKGGNEKAKAIADACVERGLGTWSGGVFNFNN
jgi:hypothetical protein